MKIANPNKWKKKWWKKTVKENKKKQFVYKQLFLYPSTNATKTIYLLASCVLNSFVLVFLFIWSWFLQVLFAHIHSLSMKTVSKVPWTRPSLLPSPPLCAKSIEVVEVFFFFVSKNKTKFHWQPNLNILQWVLRRKRGNFI